MYAHFSEAADSVLTQSYDDVELVVVVDGTPEVYDRVIRDYADREEVIVHCNDENVGLLQSRNRGAELATGDVVAFIDDDAVADEMWIEHLVRPTRRRMQFAVGGKMVPYVGCGKPSFCPQNFIGSWA